EVLHLAFVWRGAKSRAYDRWPARIAAVRDVLRVRGSDAWYNRNKYDRKVFWADTCETIISQVRLFRRYKALRGIVRRVVERLRRPVVRYQQAAIRASGRVPTLLNSCRHILFLCYGNINRSALAEQ